MSWAAAAVVGGTVVSGVLSSKATEKAADKQAQGISDAQRISKEAAVIARRDALSLYDPTFSSVFDAAQLARDELLAGRTNTYDILNKTSKSVGNILQQGSVNYQNALLGRPGEAQTPEQEQATETVKRGGVKPPVKQLPGGGSISTEGTGSPPRVLQPSLGGQSTGSGAVAPSSDLSGLTQTNQAASDLRGPIPVQRYIDQANQQPPNLTEAESRSWVTQNATANQPVYKPPTGIDKAVQSVGQRLDPVTMEPIDVYQNELGTYEAPEGTGLYPSIESLQTGAGDSISALRGGAGTATNVLRGGMGTQLSLVAGGVNQGLNDLYGGYGQARTDVNTGYDQGLSALNTSFNQGRSDVSSGLSSGLSSLNKALNTGRGDINRTLGQATGYLDPHVQIGAQASNKEAAFTGVLGKAAQQKAFDDYMSSPGQNFFRNQQERALVRNKAATGDIGGNVSTELQRQRMGNAAQFYQTDLGNIRSQADRGFQAGTTAGGYNMSAGGRLADLESLRGTSTLNANTQAANALANLEQNRGGAALGAEMNRGESLRGLSTDLAGETSGLRMTGAGMGSNIVGQGTTNIADIQRNLGRDESGVLAGVSRDISELQYGTGQQLAADQKQLTNALSGLERETGVNLANADATTLQNVINTALSAGGSQSQIARELATLLSNTAIGQGTQQANFARDLGKVQASGVTNPYGNALSTLTGLFSKDPKTFGFGEK